MLILDLAYLLAFLLLSPLWLLLIIVKPAFRAGMSQRIRPPLSGNSVGPCVWLHGSSAGEIDLLRPLVGKIEQRYPDTNIVISAFAISGYAFARKTFPQHRIIYFPIDLAVVIRRFIRAMNPRLIVVVESEFWPNFFAVAKRANIPLCVLNGKMSAKSYRNHKITRLIPWALRKATLFAVQTEDHATRFRGLGVPASSVHVTGNMKYDLSDEADGRELRHMLRKQYGISEDMPVWIGGSIHRGEDEALAWAQDKLVQDGYELQLVIVPRYPADADAIAEVFREHDLKAMRKTRLGDDASGVFRESRNVLLVDTIGDLKRYYAMSDVAYVGGSLNYRGSNKGGHNLMEPAILGIAPLFGPYNFSFRETVRALLEGDAGLQVADREQIYEGLRQFLDNPGTAAQMGARARQVILDRRGATELNFGLIEPYISAV
ncbi:MAG: glycosyltransferase N-terminal domain-containing protein [Woeseiaceae bacterium]|nr:glycosyltransferase N-terminal domain-containing protein [Woeseiaceae bacterium]